MLFLFEVQVFVSKRGLSHLKNDVIFFDTAEMYAVPPAADTLVQLKILFETGLQHDQTVTKSFLLQR